MNEVLKGKLDAVPRDIELIVGIPRSGMIPATLLSLYLNLPLMNIEMINTCDETAINSMTSRLEQNQLHRKITDYKKILVIDDSCNFGNSISNARKIMQPFEKDVEILYACVYATSASVRFVDFYFDICEQPRVFEWNIMNHNILRTACLDMDGVLCVDPTDEENDDGERYIEFIRNARPLFIPQYPIGAIVTSRLEKYREETEAWLRNNGVKYSNLIMLDLPSKEERIRLGAHSKFKSAVYNGIKDSSLFVESNARQAKEISESTNKPVYCIENNKLYDLDRSLEQYFDNKAKYEKIKIEAIGLLESLYEMQWYLYENRTELLNNEPELIQLLNIVVEAIICLNTNISKFSCDSMCSNYLLSIMKKINGSSSSDEKIDAIIEANFEILEVFIERIIDEKLRDYSGQVTTTAWSQELRTVQSEITGYIFGDAVQECDYKQEILYLRERQELMLYPYPFTEKYNQNNVDVYLDDESGYKYVFHNGKRLYFPPRTNESIQHEYKQLVMEQDQESPHTYFDEKCTVKPGSVFIDVGSAEGIISLDVIETVSEIYLIECSEEWIKALELTFSGYENKIHFVKKYAGRYDSDSTITLDSLLKEYEGKEIFVKMDVEGMELEVLKGATKVMTKNRCNFSCASYHTEQAENELKTFFSDFGYECDNSKGYMLFYFGHMVMLNGKYDHPKPPYFRRALVRAWRE